MADDIDQYLKRAQQGYAGVDPKLQTQARSTGAPRIAAAAQKQIARQQTDNAQREEADLRDQDQADRQQATAQRAQEAAQARAQREQAAAARHQQAVQTRAAAAAGVETVTDIETGRRTIATHEDGAPKFKPGPIGKPIDVGTQTQAIKDPVTGDLTPIPNAGIMLGGDGAASAAGTETRAIVKQPVRDDRGNMLLSDPDIKTDKVTGRTYTEAKDPSTGLTTKTAVGIDDNARKSADLAARADAAALQKNQIAQARLQFDAEHAPIKEEFAEAERRMKKVKDRNMVMETDPKDPKRGYWVRISEKGTKEPVDPEELAYYLKEKDQATQAMYSAKRKAEPLTARQQALDAAEQQVKADHLRLEAERIKHEMRLPGADGGVSRVLAQQATGDNPYGAFLKEFGVTADDAAATPEDQAQKAQEAKDKALLGELQAQPDGTPPPRIPASESAKQALATLKGVEGLTVTPNGPIAMVHGADGKWLATVEPDRGGLTALTLRDDAQQNQHITDLLQFDKAGNEIPLFIRENPNRPPLKETAQWASQVMTVTQPQDAGAIMMGGDGAAGATGQQADTSTDAERGKLLEQLGATPDQIKRKVANGEIPMQVGSSLLRELYGDTLVPDRFDEPTARQKWIEETTQREVAAGVRPDQTTAARWKKASTRNSNANAALGLMSVLWSTYSLSEQNEIERDRVADHALKNLGKPGVRREDIKALYQRDAADNASIADRINSIATLVGETGKYDAGAAAAGMLAGVMVDGAHAEVAMLGKLASTLGLENKTGDEAAKLLMENLGLRNRDFANFINGTNRNIQKWFTPEGRQAASSLDAAIANLERTIDADQQAVTKDPDSIRAAELQVRNAALALHALAPDESWPITADSLDPDKDAALGAALARYAATADPRQLELYKNRLLMSNGRRQFSAALEKKTQGLGRAGQSFVHGMSVGWQELIVEAAADASFAVTGGASKKAQIALRAAQAAGTASRVSRIGRGAIAVTEAAAKWDRLGVKVGTLAKPLTRTERFTNLGVKGGKLIAQGSLVGEPLEEMVVELGADDPDFGQAYLGGMMGSVVMLPIFAGISKVASTMVTAPEQAKFEQRLGKWTQNFNTTYAGTPGFKPITVEEARTAAMFVSGKAAGTHANRLVAAQRLLGLTDQDITVTPEEQAAADQSQQRVAEGAAAATLDPKTRTNLESEAARLQRRLEQDSTSDQTGTGSLKPDRRAALEEQLAEIQSRLADSQAAQDVPALQQQNAETDPAIQATNAKMMLRQVVEQAAASIAEGEVNAVDAVNAIAAETDPARKTFMQGIAKVASGNAHLLTKNERSAIQGTSTEAGAAYFDSAVDPATGQVTESITAEGYQELAQKFPAIARLVEHKAGLAPGALGGTQPMQANAEHGDLTPEQIQQATEMAQRVQAKLEQAHPALKGRIRIEQASGTFVTSGVSATIGEASTIEIIIPDLAREIAENNGNADVVEKLTEITIIRHEAVHVADFGSVISKARAAGDTRPDIEIYSERYAQVAADLQQNHPDIWTAAETIYGTANWAALNNDWARAAETVRMIMEYRLTSTTTELLAIVALEKPESILQILADAIAYLKELIASGFKSERIAAVEKSIATLAQADPGLLQQHLAELEAAYQQLLNSPVDTNTQNRNARGDANNRPESNGGNPGINDGDTRDAANPRRPTEGIGGDGGNGTAGSNGENLRPVSEEEGSSTDGATPIRGTGVQSEPRPSSGMGGSFDRARIHRERSARFSRARTEDLRLSAKLDSIPPDVRWKILHENWNEMAWSNEEMAVVNKHLGQDSPFYDYAPANTNPSPADPATSQQQPAPEQTGDGNGAPAQKAGPASTPGSSPPEPAPGPDPVSPPAPVGAISPELAAARRLGNERVAAALQAIPYLKRSATVIREMLDAVFSLSDSVANLSPTEQTFRFNAAIRDALKGPEIADQVAALEKADKDKRAEYQRTRAERIDQQAREILNSGVYRTIAAAFQAGKIKRPPLTALDLKRIETKKEAGTPLTNAEIADLEAMNSYNSFPTDADMLGHPIARAIRRMLLAEEGSTTALDPDTVIEGLDGPALWDKIKTELENIRRGYEISDDNRYLYPDMYDDLADEEIAALEARDPEKYGTDPERLSTPADYIERKLGDTVPIAKKVAIARKLASMQLKSGIPTIKTDRGEELDLDALGQQIDQAIEAVLNPPLKQKAEPKPKQKDLAPDANSQSPPNSSQISNNQEPAAPTGQSATIGESRESLNRAVTEGSSAPLSPLVTAAAERIKEENTHPDLLGHTKDEVDIPALQAIQKNLPGITLPPATSTERGIVANAVTAADSLIPPFQGNKTKMVPHMVAAILRYWTKDQREKVTDFYDLFAGGGAWGLLLADKLFPNIQRFTLNEYDPARAIKVRRQIENGAAFAEVVNRPVTQTIIRSIIQDYAAQRNGTTWGAINKYFSAWADKNLGKIDEDVIAVIKMLADSPTRGTAWDVETADQTDLTGHTTKVRIIPTEADITGWFLRTQAPIAARIQQTADRMKSGGVEFIHTQGDAYRSEIAPGPQSFVVADPPYFGTLGYNGVSIVGSDTYRDTAALMRRIADQKSNVAYTDEAWWIKPKLTDKVSDSEISAGSRIAREISNTLDFGVVSNKIGDRYETIGLNNGYGSPVASEQLSNPLRDASSTAGRNNDGAGRGTDGSGTTGDMAGGPVADPGIQPTGPEQGGVTRLFSAPQSRSVDALRELVAYNPGGRLGDGSPASTEQALINMVSNGRNTPSNPYVLRLVPLADLTPVQTGEDYLNDSSRETARRIAAGTAVENRWQDALPVLANKDGTINDGHHRHAAATLNGDATIPAVVPADSPLAQNPSLFSAPQDITADFKRAFTPITPETAFDEWGASLKEDGIVYGYRGENGNGQADNNFGATEGQGLYLAKSMDDSDFFGKSRQVAFPKPKNPLIVDEQATSDTIPLLNEDAPIWEDILAYRVPEGASNWIKAHVQAAKKVGLTEDNWGERMDDYTRALTDELLAMGHDAVYVRSGGMEWVVILAKPGERFNRGTRTRAGTSLYSAPQRATPQDQYAHKFLTDKLAKTGSLTPQEHEKLITIEKQIGQAHAFDLDDPALQSRKRGSVTRNWQQNLMLQMEDAYTPSDDRQMSLFSAPQQGMVRIIRSFPPGITPTHPKAGEWVSLDTPEGRAYQEEYNGPDWEQNSIVSYIPAGAYDDMQTGWAAGQTLVLKQDASPENISLASAPQITPDILEAALAPLTPMHRQVFQASQASPTPTPAALARRFSLSKTAVTNILGQVDTRLRTLGESQQPGGLDPATTKDGLLVPGRPERAMATNPVVARAQQIRAEEEIPVVITNEQTYAAARQMIVEDRQGTLEKLISRRANGETMTLEEVAAAQLFLRELGPQDTDPKVRLQLAWLASDWIDQGTDDARRLQIRRDVTHNPAERAALYFKNFELTPQDAQTRKAMSYAQTRAQKEAVLQSWFAKVDGIKAKLKADGIDIDASMAALDARLKAQQQAQNEASARHSSLVRSLEEEAARLQQQAEQLRAQLATEQGNTAAAQRQAVEAEQRAQEAASRAQQAAALDPKATLRLELERLPLSHRAAIENIGAGGTLDTAAMIAGTTPQAIRKIYEKFRNSLNDAGRQAAELAQNIQLGRLASASLAAAPQVDYASAIGWPTLGEMDRRTAPVTPGQKQPRRTKQAPAPAKVDPPMMSDAEFARRIANPVTPQEVSQGYLLTEHQRAMAKLPPGKRISFDAWIAKLPAERKSTIQQDLGLKTIVGGTSTKSLPTDNVGLLDFTDPVSIHKAFQAFANETGTVMDSLLDFRRMAILSGPQTSIVNTVSAGMLGAYFQARRPLEAAVNAALRPFGVRSDRAATFSEFPALAKMLPDAAAFAVRHMVTAWKLEDRDVDSAMLGTPTQMGLGGGGWRHEAITKGRFVGNFIKLPIPTPKGIRMVSAGDIMRGVTYRQMTASDAFLTAFNGYLGAVAMAHRIAGIREKLTGQAYDERMAELMLPGSEAMVHGFKEGTRSTSTQPLGKTADGFKADGRPEALTAHHTIDIFVDAVANLVNQGRKKRFGDMRDIGPFMLDLAAPFVVTPANLYKEAGRMTPFVNLFLAGFDAIRAWHTLYGAEGSAHPEIAKQRAKQIWDSYRTIQEVTNQILSLGLLYFVASYAVGSDDGEPPLITGTEPWKQTDRAARDTNARVMKPMSIRIPGTDIAFSYSRMDPFATALTSTIDILANRRIGLPFNEQFARFFTSQKNQMKEKTMLDGIARILDAVEAPDRNAERYLADLAVSMVPNMLRQPIRELDPYVRDNTPDPAAGFAATVATRAVRGVVPSLSPPRLDAFGKPVQRRNPDRPLVSGPIDKLLGVIDPTRMARLPDAAPLDRYLFRYNATVKPEERIGIAALDNHVVARSKDGKQVKLPITPQERQEATARAAERAVKFLGSGWESKPLSKDGAERIKEIFGKFQKMETERLRQEKLRAKPVTAAE